MKELIKEAKSQINEIVQKSKERYHRQSSLFFYEGEHGYVCAWVKDGMTLPGESINFGKFPLSLKNAIEIINMEEEIFWV